MNWKVFASVFLFIPALGFIAWGWAMVEEWLARHLSIDAAVLIPLAAFSLVAALVAGFITRGLT